MSKYLRVRKTVAAIRLAFLALLKDLRFEDVTVSNVVSVAGVSRSAFYAHYADLYDLLSDCWVALNGGIEYESTCPSYLGGRKRASCWLVGEFVRILLFCSENPRFASAVVSSVFSSSSASYMQKMIRCQVDYFVEFIEDEQEVGDLVSPRECAQYVMFGQMGLIQRWLAGGMREDVVVIAKRLAYMNLFACGAVANSPVCEEYLAGIDSYPDG